ncbi:MAG: hypothetical protein HXX14_19540 [Bacteroidetes bacterium]|nr:hypothetical protein [Bacteroidota bacterium]
MHSRKYVSEFGLNMHLTHTLVLQQDELKMVGKYNYFNADNPCHIYLICRRPRILIDPDHFFVNKEKIVFAFKVQRQSSFENLKIEFPNEFMTTNFKLNSCYPFNFFELLKDDEIFLQGKTAFLFQKYSQKFTEYLDFEVLYIGQSYGVEGARTAPERLQSHSTLQGIYSEAILKNPDCEIWMILTSFEQILITSMDGTKKVNDEEKEMNSDHLHKVTKAFLNDGLKEQQVINFTEAALIRYFQPPYNIEYKDTFPNPAHTSYSECYDLDINSICIELNTENINCRLFTETIKTNWNHMHDFFLHSHEDRKSMFDFEKPLSSNKLIQ